MLPPSCIRHLAGRRIILASSSPQRKEILHNIGIPFEVVPSDFKEDLDKNSFQNPFEYAIETARGKAREVAERLKNDEPPPYLIIGADTVVAMDGQIFGKPKDLDDAYSMVSRLIGRSHFVYTGVTIILKLPENSQPTKEISFHEKTEVVMGQADAETVKAYVETKEPLNRAGAYAIQKLGGIFVEGIHGDFFNVVGLPLHSLCKHISMLVKGEMSHHT